MSKISGLVQFARFSIPCLLNHDGVRARRFGDFGQKIITRVDAGGDPEPEWLIKCFPDVTAEFRVFAGIADLLACEWPLDKVGAFWVAHKGWRGVDSCATKRGIISHCNQIIAYMDFGGDVLRPILNRYSLPCRPSSIGFCHHGVLCMETDHL